MYFLEDFYGLWSLVGRFCCVEEGINSKRQRLQDRRVIQRKDKNQSKGFVQQVSYALGNYPKIVTLNEAKDLE